MTASAPSRVYAIGDIHGYATLLDRMVTEIARDLSRHPTNEALTVTLGDYVDRGPDSRGVIERLTKNPFGMPFVALRGNHESILEEFLRDPSIGSYWRQLGGLETLHSYGVDVAPLMRGKGQETAAAAFRAALPASHVEFLASLKISVSIGRYFLCHAGVRPGVPLSRQREEDLLWIRDEFLDSNADYGKIVVHGHTPTAAPEVRPNRVNVDTGAFISGQLTCAVLEPDSIRLLSVC
ncbi:MAG TPA: metallophosphoesterase family protein [Stellaceae bacterium]|nr:metallophosphoesterase family protein [Stellaceae bacterium]